MTEPVIRTTGIKKAYHMGEQTVWALDGVDTVIEPGEFVAVMGPSGSGKSTYMNMIGCLDVVSDGQVYIDGSEVSSFVPDELATIATKKLDLYSSNLTCWPEPPLKTTLSYPCSIHKFRKRNGLNERWSA